MNTTQRSPLETHLRNRAAANLAEHRKLSATLGDVWRYFERGMKYGAYEGFRAAAEAVADRQRGKRIMDAHKPSTQPRGAITHLPGTEHEVSGRMEAVGEGRLLPKGQPCCHG